MRRLFTHMLAVLLMGVSFGVLTTPAWACAVCFGDPESPMAQGALMAVLTLGAIILCVLVMVAGTSIFWLHRSMQLSRAGQTEVKPN